MADVEASVPADQRTVIHADTLGHWTEHVVKRSASEAIAFGEKQTRAIIAQVNAERQALEDSRANHRNLNRLLTLLGALVIGLAVTYLLTHPALLSSIGVGAKTAKMLAPYSFVITVLMDSTLALYSFVRRY